MFVLPNVDSLHLQELDDVVEEGEDDNGDDVAQSVPHLKQDTISISLLKLFKFYEFFFIS